MIALITGGAASGKSAFAEELCLRVGKKIAYVATMQPFGEDARRRIARHLKLREGKDFLTVEQYLGIENVQRVLGDKADTLLIECMSNLTANEIFSPDGAHEDTAERIEEGIRFLGRFYRNIIIVTNEVFCDGITYEKETTEYLKTLGNINTKLAVFADTAVEVFYGIPILRKGCLPE